MAKAPKNINFILLIVAVAAIAIYLVVKFVLKKFNDEAETGTDIPWDSSVPKPGKDFVSTNEAKLIRDKIMVFWSSDESTQAVEAFDRILNYTNNQLIAVANAYRKLYGKTRQKTLRELVRSQAPLFKDGEEKRKQVLKRLEDLQIP